MHKLNWKLNTKLEKAGLEIVRLLNKQGFQAFFVGGLIRNRLLGLASDNIDIATDATPDFVEAVLKEAGINYKQVGKKFGTILAIFDGMKIEVTTFRREGRYSDQRHPDKVEFIREYLDDAQRRDLTINALYFDPVSKQLFDPVKGQIDLKNKIIRFVGDPRKRIDEDPLRMLRAVRLAAVLGFKLERNSFAAIKIRAKLIQGVSNERVKSELDKILLTENRVFGFRLLDEIGLLKFILPELQKLKKIDHRSPRHHQEGDMYEHTLLAISEIKKPELPLLYAVLFHDIGKAAVKMEKRIDRSGWQYYSTFGHEAQSYRIFRNFSSKYPFSKNDRELISWLILHHDDRINYRESKEEKRIKYSLHQYFPKLLDVWLADSRANLRLQDNGEVLPGDSESVKLGRFILEKINAKNDLLKKFSSGEFIIRETNLKPGPQIGQVSEKIKIKIVAGKIQNESEAKIFLKKIAKKT